jgi:adenylate cyclase
MEFSLTKEESTLGRNIDNDIVLSDVKVSKRHAIISNVRNRYRTLIRLFIKDLNSSNGVRLNDTLIEQNQSYPLNDNDVILIGPISLLFCAPHHVESHSITSPSVSANDYVDLVTILPSERKYEETVTIRAELEAEEEVAFMKSENVHDIEIIRGDYEKLRMVYELSKMSVTDDINKLLSKSLDLLFEILPLDRGVVLLVDQSTGFLSPHYVKLRGGLKNERREILLSSTILNKVFYSRKCLVTSDACEDPMLGKAASVRTGQIRSVICVPLIAHNNVYGILHLDSNNKINYSNKDLSLVKAIGNQTAMVIENMNLIKEVEAKAKITEQLSRFLPPHVVDKMTNRSEIIRKGGRELYGTVVFADIRGFTNLSEKSTPQEVVNLLNEYFERFSLLTRLVKIVFKYDGIVDKYIGDAIMAVFGTIEEEDNSEYRATCAAMEFQKAIVEMNDERRRARKDPISIGVGINSGFLV